jgi:hypothetical protein
MKKSKITEEMLREAGVDTPLEFLLRIMHDKDKSLAIRMACATSAAPYRKMPLEIESSGELKLIGPFVPSLKELAQDHLDELGDDFYGKNQEPKIIEHQPIPVEDDYDDL